MKISSHTYIHNYVSYTYIYMCEKINSISIILSEI